MKVPVAALAEGQVWTSPLFFDNKFMFLPAGLPLRKRDIERLAALGLRELITAGKLKTEGDSGEGTEDSGSAEDAESNGENIPGYTGIAGRIADFTGRLHNEQVIKEITGQISGIFKIIRKGGFDADMESNPALRKIRRTADSIINIVKNNRADAPECVLCLPDEDKPAKSAVRTAVYSILIAGELNMDSQATAGITAAALLHDTGMLRLPESIVNKGGPLAPEEMKIIQSHPVLSFKIIRKELRCPKNIAAIALRHHERWDGGGYPSGLGGEAIPKEAQIICVAGAFDAMVSERPYRAAITPYNAMKILVSENQTRFAPDILNTFVNIMGIYPAGSGVVLNDGRVAKVIRYNRSAPLRPAVQIISENGSGKTEHGERIDLLKEKNLFISQAAGIKGYL